MRYGCKSPGFLFGNLGWKMGETNFNFRSAATLVWRVEDRRWRLGESFVTRKAIA